MRESDLGQVAELESQLFGKGGWSRTMLDEEFHAPARHYLVDVEPAVDAAVAGETTDGAAGAAADGTAADTASASAPADAEAPDVVRGYAGYWFDGDDAELMTVGVGERWQRRGIASALLDALLESARAQGARRMLLEVRTDNAPALAVYTRHGFERIGLRRRYYQSENKDAYVMAVDLAPRVVGFALPASQQTAAAGAMETQGLAGKDNHDE